jgi:hypothetical protein
MRVVLFLLPLICPGATVPFDASLLQSGPVAVSATGAAVIVGWQDERGREWRAEFSLDPAKPLITSIGVGGAAIIERARPVYSGSTGKRRGGWDAFFDFPPSHPDGTRRFLGVFQPTAAHAATHGDRVEVTFDGLHMGIFAGSVSYLFFPGSRLIQQAAVVTTSEPDTAFYYDAGMQMAEDSDRRPGGNMESEISYYDTAGVFRSVHPEGSERHTVSVRYRTLVARSGKGSVAVFPAPHQYFFARDFTTNLGYLWHNAWRGNVSIGIRQWQDDNSPYYPWMNAPPGTAQRLGMFLLLDDQSAQQVIADVLRFTNSDKFVPVEGYKTFAPHWHLAYTEQAMAKGMDWTPPFRPVLRDMGVDAAMIMDFHGDGHPRDLTDLRFRELEAYYLACRAQSAANFLLIPAEEANTYWGGHFAIVFPKPVYWQMGRASGDALQWRDSKYGNVYSVANADELLILARKEKAYAYQTHPRTKGSTGYPDAVRTLAYFQDPLFLGAGWKAMPSDLSSPRLGERALKLVDDMSNWGLPKKILGEVDVFQIDSTHELYAHMNVNYVRAARLPDFDHYGELLDSVARGDFFVSTGEVLLPEVRIAPGKAGAISVRAEVRFTFPLQIAEVVWGDGAESHRKLFSLDRTRAFSTTGLQLSVEAPNWKWARLAVWDVAGNGAFVNPTWNPSAGTR